MNSSTRSSQGRVIFFDGFCVLCRGVVRFLIRLDQNRVFRYSSLQGQFAREVLDARQIESKASVIYIEEGKLYERGEAVIRILKSLGGCSRFMGIVLGLLPQFLLDGLYNVIARNRVRLFGRSESCFVPTPEERMLFLP